MAIQLIDLPENLIIHEIGKRLTNYADYVRFRSSCRSLQSTVPKIPIHQLSQVPWLMLPADNEKETNNFHFFSLLENKVYNLELPEVRGKSSRGSTNGWIFFIGKSPELYFINPFTRAQIRLPPLYTLPEVLEYRPNMPNEEFLYERKGGPNPISLAYGRDCLIEKVVLSSPNSNNEYVAMVLYGESLKLAFCRSGDKKWTSPFKECFDDIIFDKGKFYALEGRGTVRVIDVGPEPKMTLLAPPCLRVPYNKPYLVKTTSNEFVIVERRYKRDDQDPRLYKTRLVRIFKWDQSNLRWKKVQRIGGDVFFLGYNSAITISSHDIPSFKGNCIYFTDNYYEAHNEGIGGYDNGVYDLKKGSFMSFPAYFNDRKLVWPPPLWVTPNPSGPQEKKIEKENVILEIL